MGMSLVARAAIAALLLVPATTHAQQVVTLGTAAGPMANAERAQPATLLRWPGAMVLIDAGDGVTDQMARAGIDAVPLRHVVITHIHADHVGGLFALLARRYQLMDPPITIHGPPGTRAVVVGLLAALAPLAITSPALPGQPARDPAAGVMVEEISNGADINIAGVRVRAVANSHYLSGKDAPDPTQGQSLSLRFDLPSRSIVITGDTGPSAAVTALAQGADVLVASILDLDAAVATIRASRPAAPEAFFTAAKAHFAQHHLSAAAAGQLAQAAGVGRIVFTHIGITPARMAAAQAELAQYWHGPVAFAADLGRH